MTDSLAERPLVAFWIGGLLLAALALALVQLSGMLPVNLWAQTLLEPDLSDLRQLLVRHSWLPRLTMSLLCGAALGLAGLLMQQVLRNPLASPSTLGAANGAQLALALATLYAPSLLIASEWVAFAGAALATLAVMLLARRRGLSPLSLILAGLVISLYLGALNVMLMMLQPQGLTALFIWTAGSLSQHSWDGVWFLLPRLALAGAVVFWLARPLALLELDETGARSVGVSLGRLRLAGLGIAVFLTACVISSVGVIGFIGLAAPAICKLMGARSFRQRLIWTPLLGAALLWLADLTLQYWAGDRAQLLPTGAVTALFGAPLLLWLLPRLRLGGGIASTADASLAPRRASPNTLWLISFAVALIALFVLFVGRGPVGWSAALDWQVLQWRVPRVVAAGSAGLMLGLAGTLLQRLTGNPMASPEIMGVSAGAALGLIGLVFFWPAAPVMVRLAIGCVGALATLTIIIGFARRQDFSPERLLLVGIAISAMFDAVQTLVLSLNDPRGQALLGWLSGSTYHVELPLAWAALSGSLLLLACCLPLKRWLTVLPLGDTAPRSLGVPLAHARLVLMGLAALLTAAATLVVGPLSFVGLMAPHMARMLGFHQARSQLLAAGLLGCLVMLAADWLGRMLIFPSQLPAGLLAAVLGGAYLVWGLSRRR